MELHGIGRLVAGGEVWTLTYERCGHVVQFPRRAVGTLEEAEHVVREHLATCSECGEQVPPPGWEQPPDRPRPARKVFWEHHHSWLS